MNHGQIVARLTNIPSTNGPKTLQPSDGSFDRPTPGRMGFCAFDPFLLANASDVRKVAMLPHFNFYAGIVVPLVQAQMLRRIGCRCGSR